MTNSIRKKLLTAFGVMTAPLIVLIVFSGYTQWTMHLVARQNAAMAVELNTVHLLRSAVQEALMPANDYIITGNRAYADQFLAAALKVDALFDEADAHALNEAARSADRVEWEKRMLTGVRAAWENVKTLSGRIFAIERPIGDPKARALMEEMDYKYGSPAMKMLGGLAAAEEADHRLALAASEAAWRRSWLILGAGMAALVAASVIFSYYYSTAFTKPIKKMHEAAEAIGKGDFKARVEVSTGDEIEGLGRAMNSMSAQLDDLYAKMDELVGERTYKLTLANDELAEREERLEQLVEQMPYPVLISRPDGVTVMVNRAYLAMAGVESAEALRGRLNILVNGVLSNDADRAELVRRAYEGEPVSLSETRIDRSDWGRFGGKAAGVSYYDVMLFPVKRPGGEVLWVVAIWRDIGEAKRARDELKGRVDDLERFMKATAGRELRMKELRERVAELERKIEETKAGGGRL